MAGADTLFQQTAQRVTGADFAPPVVLTAADFRFIVTEQLAAIELGAEAILIEPEGRNTAPAVLVAALHLAKADPQGVMLVVPTDHVISETETFLEAVRAGEKAARAGQIVTFGIVPTRPETGYGYLELEAAPTWAQITAQGLRGFVEKPDAARAQSMLEAGNYLWNAGIFIFAVDTILTAFQTYAPEYIAPVQQALDQGHRDLGFFRLAAKPWQEVPNISVDYAVMERAENLSVVPYQGHWSDLGSWEAVWREAEQDGQGVALVGPSTAINCTNTLLRSESEQLEVVGIGLEDIAVVAMPDAVLVTDLRKTQDVKEAVAALKARRIPQAESFPKVHRPWGWFETLAISDRFQVKRIHVHPGGVLSLQSHYHRSEHWVVVRGTAQVTLDDRVTLLSENDSIYVPLGTKHRLENPGMLPLVLIEVQTGSYLGEDDIIRYEDVYARSSEDG